MDKVGDEAVVQTRINWDMNQGSSCEDGEQDMAVKVIVLGVWLTVDCVE